MAEVRSREARAACDVLGVRNVFFLEGSDTCLKISGYPAGLLMNFNSTTLKAGLRRLDHPDRHANKRA